MIYIVSLLTIQTVCRPCINTRQSLLDRPMNDSVDIGILNEGAGRWRIDRALPDKGRKRRVFANPSVRNLSIQAGIGEKRKEKKNSKALLGCRWNFWASFIHSAKVNYRSIPLLPHLPHNFLSLQSSLFLRDWFPIVVFLAPPLETRSTVLAALISLMQVRAVRRSFR